jgi:Fe2+ or Zn2+ uptake regulation protein
VTDLHPDPREQRIRGAGLKVTAGRLAVMAALVDRPHADADTVHRALAADGHPLTLQAVHNVLGDLAGAGILRRVEPARSAALYELRVDDNHHHLVCSACGAVTDVDCTVGHSPCLHPSDSGGYRIDTAEVVFWGLCPACQTA